MKHIRYFNRFHNGDLHISREIIRKIICKVKSIDPLITFSYAHANDPCLLTDIADLSYDNLDSFSLDQFENLVTRGNTVSVNTWYAQQHYKYMNDHGMTLDCLVLALNDTCKTLFKFDLFDAWPEPSSFIPTIDYSKFKIDTAQTWLTAHLEDKIFVSNGQAMSGQANNFHMTPIICELAQKYPYKTWILSNVEINQNLPSNVFYSKDIIQKTNGSDLNENGFLTEHCNLIIGRASGAFTYAWTQNNLLKRNCKLLAFCEPGVMTRKGYQFWTSSLFHDKIKYSAQIFESPEIRPEKVRSIIESHL